MPYLCLLLVTTLHVLLGLLIPAEGQAPTIARPERLLFVSPTDSDFPDAQPEQYAGVGAAFLEANEDPSVLLGTRLDLMAVNMTAEAIVIALYDNIVPATTTLLGIYSNASVTGIVANSQLIGYILSLFAVSHPWMPIYGLQSAGVEHLSNPNVVSARSFFAAEFPAIFEFAIMRSGLHCTDMLVIHVEIGDFGAVDAALSFSGYSLDRIERRTVGYYNLSELDKKIKKNPSCILIMDSSLILESLVPLLYGHFQLPDSVPILSLSFASKPRYANPSFFRNLYMVQVVPDPDDATASRFVARYQRAMDRLFQTDFINNTFDFARPVTFYNYQSLEGYIVGRLIVEGAKGTLNLTRQGIVDTIYRQRLILLDDFSLGPYTRGCTVDGLFACNCFSGLRTYSISRIDPATGKSIGQRDRPEEGEVDVAISTIPLSICGTTDFTFRRPFNLLLPLPAVFGPHETWRAEAVRHFADAFGNASYGHSLVQPFRAQGSLRVVRATLSDSERSDLNATTVVELAQRYRPFAIAGAAGGTPEAAAINETSLLLATLGALPESPPAANSALKGRFDLDGSIAEFAQAAASYAARPSAGAVPAVVAATDAQKELVKKSMHTFGLQPPSVTVAPQPAAARAAIEALLKQDAPVLVVAQDETVLSAALEAIVGTAGTARAYVVAEEAVVYRAAMAALRNRNIGRGAVPRPVLLASVMRPWWQATSFGKTALALARRNASDTAYAEDPAHAKATVIADVVHQAAVEALRLYALEKKPASFAEALFSAGTLQAGELTLGPFSNTVCAPGEFTPGRQCECTKGPRAFFVHDLRDLLSNNATSATGGHQLTVKGCTIAYSELPAAATGNNEAFVFGLVGGAVGFVAVVATAVVVVVLCCFGGKSNRAAPKDESKPFAIAFTDIQSSTTLWARAPAEMAAAVEAHHDIMRQCLQAHNGYEVKTIGDSFMVAFGGLADAARFAVRAQHALHAASWAPAIDDIYRDMTRERLEGDAGAAAAEAADWDSPHVYAPLWNGLRVRVGVHFGAGRVVKDPTSGGYDYYGTVVNTAARVEGVGNGGQVLLTAAAVAELLGQTIEETAAEYQSKELEAYVAGALEEPVGVKVLGPQPLRGLDAPVALFQLNPRALSARHFPPLRLDIEVPDRPEDDAASRGTHTTASSHSVFGTAADAASAAAAALAPAVGAAFMDHFRLLETVFSTSAGKWRWETLRTLADAWQVRLPEKAALLRQLDPLKRPADADGQASLLAVVELLKKVSRVHAARVGGFVLGPIGDSVTPTTVHVPTEAYRNVLKSPSHTQQPNTEAVASSAAFSNLQTGSEK